MPTFIDLGDTVLNLNLIKVVEWRDEEVRIWFCDDVEWDFPLAGEHCRRLKEAFRQVPHIPVMGAHAKPID